MNPNYCASRPKLASRAILIWAVSIASSCALPNPQLYDGPPRERAEVARIREEQRTSVRVLKVDGRDVSGESWEVLPGRHVILATARMSKTVSNGRFDAMRDVIVMRTDCEIQFEARPGVDYLVVRLGGVEKERKNYYKFNIAINIAEVLKPDLPIGFHECGEPRVGMEPSSTNPPQNQRLQADEPSVEPVAGFGTRQVAAPGPWRRAARPAS